MYKEINQDTLFRCIFYAIVKDGEATRFLQTLTRIGYEIKKRTKEEKHWPSWGVEIAHDIHMSMVKADKIILCTSNNDFIPVVEYLIDEGKIVEVYGVGCNDRMRNACNKYTELGEDYIHVSSRRKALSSELSSSDSAEVNKQSDSGSGA